MNQFSLLVLSIFYVVYTFSSCPSQYTYSSWMGDLYNININQSLTNPHYSTNTSWNYRTLNQILIGGSHDAGMYTITSKSGLGVFVPNYFFITQSRSFFEQACAGSRWYDVRFSQRPGSWHIFHAPSPGFPLAGYSVDIDTVLSDVTNFLDDPKNSHEIIFLRIKVDSGSDINDLSDILRGYLANYMVDNPTGNMSLPTLTLNQIWEQNNTIGKVVIMAYGWVPPPVEPGKKLGWIWDYTSNQLGEFSDALTMSAMLTRCVYGQFPRLVMYKETLNDTNHKLIGMWWTFTTENIQTNTQKQWESYPNALNDFYVANQGEIGNSIMSDFFGDYLQFMTIVWDYNFNKYGNFPPLNATNGHYYNDDPPLPGIDILTNPSSCQNYGSAQTTFNTTVLAVFIVVLIILIFLICCVPIIVYCCKKKSSKESSEDCSSLTVVLNNDIGN